MRNDPLDVVAPSRALSLLSLRNYVLPAGKVLPHPAGVNSARFSPDGALVLTASDDGAVRVWNRTAGRLLKVISHEASVTTAEFLLEGEYILALARDNVARIYDTASGKLRYEIPGLQEGLTAPVERGGAGWLCSPHEANMVVSRWDLRTGQHLKPDLRLESRAERIRWSNRSGLVAIACADGSVRVIDASTGKMFLPARQFEGIINNFFFPPNGEQLVISLDKGERVAVWHLGGHDQVSEFAPSKPAPMQTMAFTPDGKRLVASAWATAPRILDAKTFEFVAGLPGPDPQGWAEYTVSHDGSLVAGFGQDGTARIWDTETGQAAFEAFEHEGWIRSLVFSPDDTHLATASQDGTVRIWDARMRQASSVTFPPAKSGGEAVFNQTGTRVIVGLESNVVQVCDAKTGQPLSPPLLVAEKSPLRSSSFSKDDTRFLTVILGKEGIVRVWDARLFAPLLRFQVGEGVTVARFSPDGRFVVTGDRAGYAKVWDIESGERVGAVTDFGQEVIGLDFHPSGELFLTACVNGLVRCYSLPTGQSAGPALRHQGIVWDVVFSRTGDRVLTSCADRTAQVWDTRTGRRIGKPMQHESQVYLARFSPDDNYILTTSDDGTARVWSARTGEPVSRPMRHSLKTWMGSFTPDGKTVATGSHDGTARLWDAQSGLPLSDPLPHPDAVTRLSFNPQGDGLLTFGGQTRIWDVITAPKPVPVWFCDLVEAVGGVSLSPDGQVIPIPSTDRIAQVRDQLAKNGQPNFYSRWARWFLIDRTQRPVPPVPK
jgi:WD40 repeat protein